MHISSLARISFLTLLLFFFTSCRNKEKKRFERTAEPSTEIGKADSLVRLGEFAAANKILSAQLNKTNDTLQIISINNRLAHNYRKLGEYNLSFSFCKKSLSFVKKEKIAKSLQIAQTYYLLGLLYRNFKTDSSAYYLNKALQIRTDLLGENSPLVGDVYNNLGVIYINKSYPDSAIILYKKALALRKKRGENHPSVGSTYMNLANAYEMLGNFNKSLAYFDTALAIQKKLNIANNPYVAAILTNMASSYDDLGMVDKSMELWLQALAIYKNLYGENHPYIATIYNNIAVQRLRQGDYKQAAEYLSKSIELKKGKEKELGSALTDNYINLGETYLNLERYETAAEVLRKGLKIANQNMDIEPYSLTMLHFLLADAYFAVDKPQKAIESATAGLHASEEFYGTHSFQTARANYKTAVILIKLRRYGEAGKFLQKAYRFFLKRSNEYPIWVAHSLFATGEIEYGKGNYHKAIRQIEKLEEKYSRPNGTLDYMKISKYGLGNLFIKAEELHARLNLRQFEKYGKEKFLHDAKRAVLRAEKLFEHLRYKAIKNEKSKIILSKRMSEVFQLGLEVLYELYSKTKNDKYFETALNLSEKNKSLALFESVSEKQLAELARLPDTTFTQLERLRSRIFLFERKIEAAENENDLERTNKLRAELFSLKRKYESETKKYMSRITGSPEFQSGTYSLSIEEITKNLLAPDQTILEFFLSDSAIFAFVINAEEHAFIRTPTATDINNAVNGFIESIAKRNETDYKRYGYSLYENLIAPCEPYINTERILIINDGILAYVPYDALLYEKPNARSTYGQLPYLIKKYSFGYGFSLGLLMDAGEADSVARSFIGIAPFGGEE